MGSVRACHIGNCYDNACAESFFSSLKNELVHFHNFNTREEARAAIFEYIEIFYNRQHLHQTLDYLSPVELSAVHVFPKSLSTKSGLAHPCLFPLEV